MAKRYFTTTKSGEEVEVDQDIARELVALGKKKPEDFEIEETDDIPIAPTPVDPQQEIADEENLLVTPPEQPQFEIPDIPLTTGGLTGGIEEGERFFQERIAPQQAIVQESKVQEAEERKVRRLAGDETAGEAIESALFTRGVTEDPDVSGPGSELLGLLSLPARALGKVLGKGDISEESTKLFKGNLQEVADWVQDRENQNRTADEMIEMLKKSLVENAVEPEQEAAINADIAKLEEQKNSGVLTTAIDVINSFVFETASDPLAIVGIARGAVMPAVKILGKQTAKKTVTGVAEDVATKSAKKLEDIGRKELKASDITFEKTLGEAGGPKEVIARLEKQGIKRTSSGEFIGGRKILRKNVDALSKKGIKEFDLTDAAEAKITPIDKRLILDDLVSDAVTDNPKALVESIIGSGKKATQIKKILREAEIPNANLVAGRIANLGEDVTGREIRDLIADLNRKLGATIVKDRTASQIAIGNFKDALQKNLTQGVKKSSTPEEFSKYLQRREVGTAKFSDLKSKLKNIIKRKGDETLDTKASVNALEKQFNDAVNEIKLGDPAESVEFLKEADNIIGSNMSEQARDLALAEKLDISIAGDIGVLPTKAPTPKVITSPGGLSIAAGRPAAQAAVATGFMSRIATKIKGRNIRKAVSDIGREVSKTKASQEALKGALRDPELGRQFIAEQLSGGRANKILEILTSKGVLTPKEIIQVIGQEETERIIAETENSGNNKLKRLGINLRKASQR